MSKFPVQFSIQIFEESVDFFENARFAISPPEYPNALVLSYSGKQDGIDYQNVLDLNMYPTSDSLSQAINSIRSPYLLSDVGNPNRVEARVFSATVDYTSVERSNELKPTTGTIYDSAGAVINFSVEDKAWIVGDKGTVLVSNNSGAKWEISDIGMGYDFLGSSFVDNNTGWIVGSSGSVVKYQDTTEGPVAELQDTDLVSQTSGRIYPEGNVLSEAENFLPDNIIDPQVGVETTQRVQIQYRIRVVDGINPFENPDSGLGANFVYSRGPNASGVDAGGYTYTNMGKENGDYGLWRARCRNTVDGYSWAIPMFIITRKNSSPFDSISNINGSTNYELGAIRPDGSVYSNVTSEEVTDIRKLVNVQSYSRLLENNLDKLLSNKLYTNIADRDERGAQSGPILIDFDAYSGTSSIQAVVRGQVSSEATLNTSTKVIDPSITPTEDDLTFETLDNGLYHNDPAFYRAVIVSDGVETNETIPGVFVGLGTKTVKFILDDSINNAPVEDKTIEYKFVATYIDYGNVGLNRVPSKPLSIRYNSDTNNELNVFYYNGISTRTHSIKSDPIEERVTGYPDYT